MVEKGIYIIPIDIVKQSPHVTELKRRYEEFGYDVGLLTTIVEEKEKLLGGVSYTVVDPSIVILGIFVSTDGILSVEHLEQSLRVANVYCRIHSTLPIYGLSSPNIPLQDLLVLNAFFSNQRERLHFITDVAALAPTQRGRGKIVRFSTRRF